MRRQQEIIQGWQSNCSHYLNCQIRFRSFNISETSSKIGESAAKDLICYVQTLRDLTLKCSTIESKVTSSNDRKYRNWVAFIQGHWVQAKLTPKFFYFADHATSAGTRFFMLRIEVTAIANGFTCNLCKAKRMTLKGTIPQNVQNVELGKRIGVDCTVKQIVSIEQRNGSFKQAAHRKRRQWWH